MQPLAEERRESLDIKHRTYSNRTSKGMEEPHLPSVALKITMTVPTLQGVKHDDRAMVRNVLYLLHACKHPERMCTAWSVTNMRSGPSSGYAIIGLIDQFKDYEMFQGGSVKIFSCYWMIQ